MAHASINEIRTDRTIDLMSKFFEYDIKATQLIRKNGDYIDIHEFQLQAAYIIHDLEEEGLLHIAKDIYSWEKETINDYLEMYNETQGGVRI